MNRIGGPSGVAPLADVQPQAAAALHRVRSASAVVSVLALSHRSTSGSSVVGAIVGRGASDGAPHLGPARTYLRLRARLRMASRPAGGAILTGCGRAARRSSDACASSEALERALDAARAGSGATVLVAGRGRDRQVAAGRPSSRGGRARPGFEVLVGRSIDLVGTELPFQPFVEALRPLGRHGRSRRGAARSWACSRRRSRSCATARRRRPCILVLEDLHWADTSSLDLVLFLTHHLAEQRRPAGGHAAARTSRRRPTRAPRWPTASGAPARAWCSSSGRSTRAELRSLLAARDETLPRRRVADAIVARSDGNPFFAEELLAAAGARADELPRGLREMLLRACAGSTGRPRACCAWPPRAVATSRIRCCRPSAALPEREVRDSLRQAVQLGILVPDQAAGSFRFRHALLAEAIYATILPGEREWLHGRLADELARTVAAAPGGAGSALGGGRPPARRRWSRPSRPRARRRRCSGWRRPRSHLERALALWDDVPGRTGVGGARPRRAAARGPRSSPARSGDAPRAVQLIHRAIELEGGRDPLRAGTLHERLGKYLLRRAALATRSSARSNAPWSSLPVQAAFAANVRGRWPRSAGGLHAALAA